jgi:hypothetical protein
VDPRAYGHGKIECGPNIEALEGEGIHIGLRLSQQPRYFYDFRPIRIRTALLYIYNSGLNQCAMQNPSSGSSHHPKRYRVREGFFHDFFAFVADGDSAP